MTWDSKFGAMVSLNFQNTDVANWTTNARYEAAMPPLGLSWRVPQGAVFYPVYAFAQFDGGAAASGSLTFKIGTSANADLPGTARTVCSDGSESIALSFNTARSCRAAAGTSINPVFVTSSDWADDACTGVMVQLIGFLSDS